MPLRRSRLSQKAGRFTESVIRGMTKLCIQHEGINLAQGFPDFEVHPALKKAAKKAIDEGINQYSITWGAPRLRQAIARKMESYNRVQCDPERDVTVTCGSTEAMIASLLAVVDPGDEVVVFEPFYENYGPDTILSGAVPCYVTINAGDSRFDPDELRAAFSPRTRAIILNTPNNPIGKVFSRGELEFIAALCREHDVIAITDEIYEHILYDDRQHVSIASLPGMQERTITICGLSKTYSVTGWRLAYAVACGEITDGIRKVHDFLTVGAPAPLQEAGAVAFELPDGYYRELRQMYQGKRDYLMSGLQRAGFRCLNPEGAYYIMTDISSFGFDDDTAFAHWLVSEIGVAAVPGSSFYHNPDTGRQQIRFCFCKKDETLQAAVKRLERLCEAG
ncbi:MAG: aminotransferase class I/II-fold pyridoxal phosphate-dependent enzyme [Deltaproteobacteria bacterium]|nr:aminotransferase class I/II-fold pyridoxal phosphate-dependent enzyme [Deltaproteobacteria bacterium]